jgi:hypothetical protein
MTTVEYYGGAFMPFGLPACEDEVDPTNSGELYKELYLRETPFDSDASQPYTYLIVGRRGAGKTALAQSFRFSPHFKNPYHIFVEPADYHDVLHHARSHIDRTGDVDLFRMTKIWEQAIWTLIDQTLASSTDMKSPMSGILRGILGVLIEQGENALLHDEERKTTLQDVKARSVEKAKRRPVIIAIDTLERYSVSDTTLLKSIAALIQFAKDFNRQYSPLNLHLKVLMSGEIFPHLEQGFLENPLKSVRSTVFLLWQPKPLLRLIAYRFYRYLLHQGYVTAKSLPEPDWNNYGDVLAKVWNPHFGEYVINGRGAREHTFPYLLRHTQMRPRQLIVLCNRVAHLAKADGVFPRMQHRHLVEGVEESELTLANEIINAFSPSFDNMNRILNSMHGCSMHFRANELDQRAWGIKKEWRLIENDLGDYSAENYRAILAELGVVGVVRKNTEQYIQAEFEYSIQGRLEIAHQDECVIHPMFYKRLNVRLNTARHVLPFSPDSLGVKY